MTDLPRASALRWPPAWWVAATAALLVLVPLAVWVGWPARPAGNELAVEVFDHGRGLVVYRREVVPGEEFRLEHTHSVTRRLVVETFSVPGPEGIAMEELWFDDYGPNLPAGPQQIGDVTTTFLTEDGAFRVLHHGRLLPTVPLRVGSAAVDHVLEFTDGTRLRLLDLTEPAAFVELRATTG